MANGTLLADTPLTKTQRKVAAKCSTPFWDCAEREHAPAKPDDPPRTIASGKLRTGEAVKVEWRGMKRIGGR